MLRYFVPVAFVLLSLAYFQFQPSNKTSLNSSPPPQEGAAAPIRVAANNALPAPPMVPATTAEAQAAIKEEILRLAPRSSHYNGLPDGDRERVIEESVKVYSYGQIKYANLGDFIHELSSTRYHAVHEREHPMLTEESFATIRGSGQ